jgi:hypothetical protein
VMDNAPDLPFDVSEQDANEISEHFRVKARDEFLADMAIVADPDGFPEPTTSCIDCGQPFRGVGRLCNRCFVMVKL